MLQITALWPIALSIALALASNVAQGGKAKPEDGVEEELRFSPGDEAGNESKALQAELLIQKSEKKALLQLQGLIQKHAGTPLEADLLFRQAELYVRRARSERFFEAHRVDEQALRLAPSVVKDASELAEIRKAIVIYKDIRKRFVDFGSLDIVTFNQAFANQQIGLNDEAEILYLQLPAKFPDSSLVADSWLALGEISYQKRQYPLAFERFLKVKDFPEARSYPYALYKSAWCRYNMQDAKGAMQKMEETVAFGREAAKSGVDAKLDLRKEALGDMAVFFPETMSSSRAVEYFSAQAEGLDPAPYVMKLVEIYKRHGKFDDLDVGLSSFLRNWPQSELVPGARVELAWNNERELKRKDAVAQMEALQVFCTAHPGSGKVAVLGTEPETCEDRLAEVSQKLAGKWHALWKKRQPVDELADSAEKAYTIYLAVKGNRQGAETRFSYAELLFQRAKFRQASREYAAVAAEKPPQPLAHDAAYGAIVSLERAVEVNEIAKWSDADEARLNELATAYLKNNPKGIYAFDIRFKQSYLAYEKGRLDEAASGLRKIGWGEDRGLHRSAENLSEKQNEKILKAQDLYMDILNQRKEYRALKEAARDLLKRAEAPRRQSIEKIYRQAYFSEIQANEDKGDLRPAIAAYKTFALENKDSELAPQAWWNASQLMFKLGDAEGGAGACYQLHKLFPNSANGKDCLNKAAQTFEAMGRLDLAARVLLNLAQVDPESVEKWRELSADFFALSGGRARAIAMYEKLGEGQPPARKLVYFEKISALAKAANNRPLYLKTRAQIEALGIEPQAADAAVESVEEILVTGDLSKAFNASKKVLGRSGASKSALARARMIEARVLEDEFQRQSVKAKPERLALVLSLKTEKLEKAQSAYQSTIRYGDLRTSIQALRRLSGIYRGFAEAVRTVPTPEGASSKEVDAFRGELERLATPLEEKGVESLAQALETAKKSGVRDGTIGELEIEFDKANMKKTLAPIPPAVDPLAYVPRFGKLGNRSAI